MNLTNLLTVPELTLILDSKILELPFGILKILKDSLNLIKVFIYKCLISKDIKNPGPGSYNPKDKICPDGKYFLSN